MGPADPGSNPGNPIFTMATKTKKVKSSGKFGARYGKKVRENFTKVDSKQRQKQICPFCKKPGVKRTSKGIWNCKKCNKRFASDTYSLNIK